MVDFRAARRAMVDGQIRTNDVTDLDLIDAMLDVPREAFVPERLAALGLSRPRSAAAVRQRSASAISSSPR